MLQPISTFHLVLHRSPHQLNFIDVAWIRSCTVPTHFLIGRATYRAPIRLLHDDLAVIPVLFDPSWRASPIGRSWVSAISCIPIGAWVSRTPPVWPGSCWDHAVLPAIISRLSRGWLRDHRPGRFSLDDVGMFWG